MKKKQKNEIMLIIVFALFIFGFSKTNFNSADIQKENTTIGMIPHASDDINSSNVFIDKSIVHRGIETLNITYNNTDADGNAFYSETLNYFVANITFSDNSELNITLSEIGTTHLWSTLFTPSIFNITGDTYITILVVQRSDDKIVNTGAEYDRIFKISNNLPKIGIEMNTTEVYRNNTIKINYIPSDIEDNVMDLVWEVKLFDPTDDINPNITLVSKGEKNFSTDIFFPISFNVGEWRVEATCWDSEADENSSTVSKTFLLKNNNPVIENIIFQIEDNEPVDAESTEILNIFRGTDHNLTIYVNATDIENNEMNLTISAEDPITGDNLLANKYTYIPISINQTSNFTTNVSFPITSGLGITNLKIQVLEDETVQDEYNQKILILNNAPILNNFTINGEFGNQTNINQGEWLSFKFGAEDEENSIEYVLISIIYYDDLGAMQFLNYSTVYSGIDTEILVRGEDLKLEAGVYIVYAYVFDSDGASATCAPQSFAIEPIRKVNATSWLLFVIGIIIGLTFTFVGVYSYYRKKFGDLSLNSPDEKGKKKLKDNKTQNIADSDKKSEKKPEKKSKKKKLIRKL